MAQTPNNIQITIKVKRGTVFEVCAQCGLAANYLTCMAKFGCPPKQPAFTVSTFHKGTCDVCLRTDIEVTEPRDFFYPNFKLINKAAWRKALREAALNGTNKKGRPQASTAG